MLLHFLSETKSKMQITVQYYTIVRYYSCTTIDSVDFSYPPLEYDQIVPGRERGKLHSYEGGTTHLGLG